MCLTFSLVLGNFKQLHYPNNNMNKCKKMMINQSNVPMTELVSEKQIIIFWSNTTGSLPLSHFVSLISHKGIRENKKRKIGEKSICDDSMPLNILTENQGINYLSTELN